MLSRVVFGPPFHSSRDDEKQQFLTNAREALIQLKAN